MGGWPLEPDGSIYQAAFRKSKAVFLCLKNEKQEKRKGRKTLLKMTENAVKKKLTAKERAFVREYNISRNATDAARKAGYSEKTAAEIGYENLKKPHISALIKKKEQEAEQKAEITKQEIIDRLLRLADKAEQGAEFAAAIRSTELLGKQIGMFKEKLELSKLEVEITKFVKKV